MARPPRFDDDEILDRAMVELWRHGWANTSIRDLEQALQLKAPSIYRRFDTKAGLGVAVVEHYVERVVRRRIEKYLPGSGDPVENIQAFLECAVMPAETDDELWGCLITTIAVDTGGPAGGEAAPELAAALRRGLAAIEAGLRCEVERAAHVGRLAETIDVESATGTIALVMQGLMAQARAGVPAPELQQRARAAVQLISA